MRDSATIYLSVFNVFPSSNPRHKDSNKYWYYFTSSVASNFHPGPYRRLQTEDRAEGNVSQVTVEGIKASDLEFNDAICFVYVTIYLVAVEYDN